MCERERTLISRMSIVILSGWLAGMSTHAWLRPPFDAIAFYAGVLGLGAFVALDLHRRLYRHTGPRRVTEQGSRRLRERVARHVQAAAQR